MYKFVQFPDNFSPAQIEISDIESSPTLCHPALTASSTGPPTLVPNYHKQQRADKHVGDSPYSKISPKKRARGQRSINGLGGSGTNAISENGGLSMFDLLTLAASSIDQSPSLLPLQLMEQNSDLRNTSLAMPWSINQLLALQYLAELNQNPNDVNIAQSNGNGSYRAAYDGTNVGSDGEVASSCSVSPESKNRSQSISPKPHHVQDEPLDLSKPKRMKLSITAPQEHN